MDDYTASLHILNINFDSQNNSFKITKNEPIHTAEKILAFEMD